MKVWDLPKCRDANVIADVIEKFCAETRRTLGQHGYALSKHVAGQVPDNVAADQVNLMPDQGERLLAREGPMLDYRKRSDVEQLMAEVSASTSVPSDS